MNNRPYFGGFFTCENMQTYKKNGVTVHKPPFGNEFWGRTAHMVFADFVDADSGEITDQFYGSCNDFNISFLAKAALRSKHKAELCAYLGENGIGVGTFYPVPLHQQKAFNCENCSNPMTSLPNAERAAKETVCLPIFPEMTDEQVDAVIEAVNRFCGVKK